MNETCAKRLDSEFEKLFSEFDEQLNRMDQFSSEIFSKTKVLSPSNPSPVADEKENLIPDGMVGELIRKLKYMKRLNDCLLDSVNELRRIVG